MNYKLFAFWVLLVVIAVGGYFYPQVSSKLGVASSTAGTVNADSRLASIALNPTSRTSTSTSLYNGDATDRIVTDGLVSCTGLTNMFAADSAGVATFNVYAATSSAAAPTASVANATFAAMNVSVATSTVDGFTATSTYTSAFSRRWNAGSYMIFQTNATSSAAACTVALRYISG